MTLTMWFAGPSSSGGDTQVILLLQYSIMSDKTRGKQPEVVREGFLEEVRFESYIT